MYKSFFALLIVGLLLAGPALASAPPAHGGYAAGWGNNPLPWQDYVGPSCEKSAIYDPYLGDWNVYQGASPFCCEIRIELWIEMSATMTIPVTTFMYHRLGNFNAHNNPYDDPNPYGPTGEIISGNIVGSLSSNHTQDLCMMGDPDSDLNFLAFQHDIFGGFDGQDIPVNWEYASGSGLFPPPEVQFRPGDPVNNMMCIRLLPCDHWFWWWFWFYIPYHWYDGYYVLYFAICPLPVI